MRKRILSLMIIFGIGGAVLLTGLFAGSSQTASAGEDPFVVYLPVIISFPVSLTNSWLADSDGNIQQAFASGEEQKLYLSGKNQATGPITATIQIQQNGPCSSGLIYSDTAVLTSGSWQQEFHLDAPACAGLYTTTSTVNYQEHSITIDLQFLVNDPVESRFSDAQGFDRCLPPSIDALQTWWNASPYYVYNIYLGGVHYPAFCQDEDVDAFWVHEVAAQGWQFTATWVGPQAPCSGFTHKISANLATAYNQGKEQAGLASAAARKLGLFGDLTLIYDIEGYGGDTACRNAVDSFIQGWTDQVRTLGFHAGVYGSPCNSHIIDWFDNNPIPDQVWIAHWLLPAAYDPDANVWDVPCGVSNSMWASHQRIKQYAGDHVESWGGTAITIDTNVFDSLVLGWPESAQAPTGPTRLIDGYAPTGQQTGWLLTGGRLFATENLGAVWSEIGPGGFYAAAVDFINQDLGWVSGWQSGSTVLSIARTLDGGETWEILPLDAAQSPAEIGGVYLQAVDRDHLYLAVKLPSGSSFSLGRLFASADGGHSWEERPHPLGEPVTFTDVLHGWTSGGPDGRRAFRTSDGGWTWVEVDFALVPVREAGLQLPAGAVSAAETGGTAWALVQQAGCDAFKTACSLEETIRYSIDGGTSWTELQLPER